MFGILLVKGLSDVKYSFILKKIKFQIYAVDEKLRVYFTFNAYLFCGLFSERFL